MKPLKMMNKYRADLHIHSVLSPCGNLEMSPGRIVKEALGKGLDIIAVTDHNHTGHARLTRKLAEEKGLWVIYGSEITSVEEVHCLTFFDNENQLTAIQEFIEANIPKVANEPELFGDQVIVDGDEMIVEEVGYSLYPAVNKGIDEIAEFVHGLGGSFVPAHVDRKTNGLFAQLGFFPDALQADAIEIHRNTSISAFRMEHPELERFQILKNSDAHYPEDIGRASSVFRMKELNFVEFQMALGRKDGREIVVK